jgi:lipid II:glycine glycyltransferase (peptidoglycan interpeptide bridge formation enzyme)
LLIAYKDDKAIASWIFIFDKDISIYYYWASTNNTEYRNLMAPYLLQWTAIQKAKSLWSNYYDFLWIASPGELNSSLAWVTDFKLKLTKDLVKVSDSYIWVRNKWLYGGICFLRKMKGKK